jgi:hypothetical protein
MGGEEMGGDERGEERMLCYFRLCYVMARSSDLVKEGLVVEGVPAHLRGEAGGERRSETGRDEMVQGIGTRDRDGLEWMFRGGSSAQARATRAPPRARVAAGQANLCQVTPTRQASVHILPTKRAGGLGLS